MSRPSYAGEGTFDFYAVWEALERHYMNALDNHMPLANCRAYASGQLHEELSVIVRRWQDGKIDEEAAAKELRRRAKP